MVVGASAIDKESGVSGVFWCIWDNLGEDNYIV